MNNKKELPKEWFRKAGDDILFAEAGFKDTRIPADACFLSQQSAEKFLKGFLVFSGQEYPRSHDLLFLLKICIGINPDFKKLNSDCKFLTKYYTAARYPDDMSFDFSSKDAVNALAAAKRIEKIVSKLSNN